MVNSLHWQGLDRIAAGLTVEAEAEDGTPEAVSVSGAKVFALGVQWHPGYKAWEHPFSRELFAAFGTAARRRSAARSSVAVFPLAATAHAGSLRATRRNARAATPQQDHTHTP